MRPQGHRRMHLPHLSSFGAPRQTGVRAAFFLISTALYAWVFVLLVPTVRESIFAVSIVPCLVAGWLMGARGGLAGGLVVSLLNTILYSVSHEHIDWSTHLIRGGAPAVISMALGGFTGYLSELLYRVKNQTEELASDREALKIEIAQRQGVEEMLHIHARRQALVVELGQRALATKDLTALMNGVVALVAQTLDVEYCKILELLPEGHGLLLRAGVGWSEGLVGHATVGTERDSQAGYTLLSREPVIVEDLRTETRFSGPRLLRDHQVVSGLSVIIHGQGRPFGVLGAHTRAQRHFTKDDVRFLQAVANVLSTAIERKRVEDTLRQSEKLAAMGQLLAGVAHELNSPLTVILGQAGLLRLKLGDEARKQEVNEIIHAADRCARIVRNFLALARQRPPERRPVDLNQVVREAVDLMSYPCRVDNVEVRLDLAADLPLLRADPDQLQQLVINLLSNAHHAMRNSQSPRKLTLTTRTDEGNTRVSLEVADTGSGIPPEIRSRIFEPFFTTKPLGEGTGLGLSLCQGIVQAHGGAIRVQSQLGEGTVFRVELPVEVLPDVQVAHSEVEASAAHEGKSILVVDDEPGITKLLTAILSAKGHRVETASNGALALTKLEEGDYDLILSDLKMPELSGPGLYQEVARRHPGLLDRFIFFTGDVLSRESREFLERSKVPCLNKPFSERDVLGMVEQVLQPS